MDGITVAGRVTNSTGEVDPNGDIVGCLWQRIGTMIDPGRPEERPGRDDRLAAAIDAADDELAAAQLAGVRRLLGARP